MPIYALLKLSLVVNVVAASQEFIDSLDPAMSDAHVLIEDGQPTPNIGDKYENGEFVTALSRPAAIAKRLTEFDLEFRTWVESRYDVRTQIRLHFLFTQAKEAGLTNRAAYLKRIIDWVGSLATFGASVIVAIQSQPTAEAVIDYVWDLSPLTATDPLVTVGAAIQIPD